MDKIVELKNIKKSYTHGDYIIHALHDMNLSIRKGDCIGLVGGSGCGKTTIANIITCLERSDEGQVYVNGEDVEFLNKKSLREIYRHVQMVFQSPKDSFNPRIKIGRSIMDVMINYGMPRKKARQRMYKLLDECGLPREYSIKYPHQLSGGECQRAAIARAISIEPDLLICDEATSALDTIVQRQILDLLLKIKREKEMALLFISHDIGLVQQICERIIVMNKGRIVERGITDDVVMRPKHEYTRSLIEFSSFMECLKRG